MELPITKSNTDALLTRTLKPNKYFHLVVKLNNRITESQIYPSPIPLMTLDDLRQQIASGKITFTGNKAKTVDKGVLCGNEGKTTTYTIEHGWNIERALRCDEEWKAFSLDLFDRIVSSNLPDEEQKKIAQSIQTEDFHWDWFEKSYRFHSNDYEWFFLIAEGQTQGICLIFHPKGSAIESHNIFYIEYFASAPWNRDSLLHKREWKQIGTKLLKAALNHSTGILKMRAGFSLHSLPQATRYYEKLKMIHIAKCDKPNLLYYELPEPDANELLQA